MDARCGSIGGYPLFSPPFRTVLVNPLPCVSF